MLAVVVGDEVIGLAKTNLGRQRASTTFLEDVVCLRFYDALRRRYGIHLSMAAITSFVLTMALA
jgi:hypothetical protein